MNQFKDTEFSGINLSATIQKFDHKPTKEAGDYTTMQFKRKWNVNLPFVGYDVISAGRTIGGVFDKPIISAKERSTENFIGSQIFFIDIDGDIKHANLNRLMDEFENDRSIYPTLAYTTPNHMVYLLMNGKDDKGTPVGRYRLVYITKQVVNGEDNCKAFSRYLLDRVGKVLEGVKLDASSANATQLMHGNGVPEGRNTQYYVFSEEKDGKTVFHYGDKKNGIGWIKENIYKGEDVSGWLEMFDGKFGTTSVQKLPQIDLQLYHYYYDVSETDLEQWRKDYPDKERKGSRGQGNGQETDLSMFSAHMQGLLMAYDSNYDIVDALFKSGWEPIQDYKGVKHGKVIILPDYVDPSLSLFRRKRGGGMEMVKVEQGKRSGFLFSVACKTWYMVMDDNDPFASDKVLANVLWCNKYFVDNSVEPIERREILNIVRDAMSKTREQLVESMNKSKYSRKPTGWKVAKDEVRKGEAGKTRNELLTEKTDSSIRLAMIEVSDNGERISVASVARQINVMFSEGRLFDVSGRPRKKCISRSTISKYFDKIGLTDKKRCNKTSSNLSVLSPDMSIEDIMNTLGCKQSSAYIYKAKLKAIENSKKCSCNSNNINK